MGLEKASQGPTGDCYVLFMGRPRLSPGWCQQRCRTVDMFTIGMSWRGCICRRGGGTLDGDDSLASGFHEDTCVVGGTCY